MKKNKTLWIGLGILFLHTGKLSAQNPLSLKDAIEKTLASNFDIKLVSSAAEQAHVQNTAGNAGFLPSVGLNAGYSKQSNDLNQSFSNGLEVNKNGVGSSNLNGSLALNWTLFDGLKMFATRDRLRYLDESAQLKLRQQSENSVLQLIQAYYNLLYLQKQKEAINRTLSVLEENLIQTENKARVGSASELSALQTRVDYNTQRSTLFSINQQIRTQEIQLNVLMGEKPDNRPLLLDSLPIPQPASGDENWEKLNTNLQLVDLDRRIQSKVLEEAISLRYPGLNFQTAYGINRTENQAGFSLLNQTSGISAGLGLNWTLFNGNKQNILIKSARIGMQFQDLRAAQQRLQLSANRFNAQLRLQTALNQYGMEVDNLKTAERNAAVVKEAFLLGSATQLQWYLALQTLETTATRLSKARLDAALAESELKLMEGKLLVK